ncbi:hypothetical protein [Prauserella muralis]|uniref:Uncharacterized protein n=1 Tax=Prauserella muralis TaxID=588067 RepID=A0A2V4AMI8_9PSEU|nr:hypothetical protein [Prauserella muralis]PXY20829.1 hypothetical protein BAY60_25320 [Prauserella muralis]TWE29860.1 hypothetical protein FHX69_2551 [Prauserella muralis]
MDADTKRIDEATRITLRPIASPLPLGFLAFAMGSGLLSMEQFGFFGTGQEHNTMLLLAVFIFPMQLLASVFAFLGREPVAATALGVIAFSWPATALVTVLADQGATNPLAGGLSAVIALVLALLAAPGLQGKPVVGTVVTLGAARYTLNAVFDFTGSHAVELASASVGAVILLLGVYGGLALVLEDTAHRTVLPFPRLGEARRALETDLTDQASTVTREAGVRRQL